MPFLRITDERVTGGGPSRRSGLATWLGALLLAALPLGGGAAYAEDGDLARFLLDAGRKSLEKKQYDDALTKLEKAAAEDPALVEARYWIAVAHDKKGDAPKAVAAYRAFRTALDEDKAASSDKELAKLAKASDARLLVLAAAEAELQKLRETFAAKALALAKAQITKDPVLAERVLRQLLIVAPQHAEASALLQKIAPGAAPEAPAAPEKPAIEDGGPYKDVTQWNDLLANQVLGGKGKSYANGILILEEKVSGTLSTPKKAIDSTKSFVYEIEFRLMETFDTGMWRAGLVFGETALGTHLVTMVSTNDLILLTEVEREREVLEDKPIPPIRPEEWHRLAVVVAGNRAEVFLDDKQIVAMPVPKREHLAGNVGLFHQRSRLEVRRWRIGTRG